MSDSISYFDASEFLEAVIRDDVDSVCMYRSIYPQLFEATALAKWKENPMVVACKHRSRRVAEKFATDYPEFLRLKNQEGSTPLHLTASIGDLPLVQLLVNLDPKLCLFKDRLSRIPLQIAVSYGYGEVIRALIAACPESIGVVNCRRETLFHLAAKDFQPNAFQVLLEETRRLKQEHLLHRKNRRGDNILHIAAANNLIGIVQLLFPDQHFAIRALVRVNTLNKKRLTALDMYYQSSRDLASRDIERILREAGGLEAHSLPMRAHLRWTLETKNLILTVLALITAAAFTTVCNLPSSFLKDYDKSSGALFLAGDVISGHLPPIFYLMVFNTAILMVCMGAIVVLMWTLPFRPVVVFLSVNICIVYALLVKNIMPKFLVTVGNNHKVLLSSCSAVWLLAVAFICSGAIIYYYFSLLLQFTKWAITKTAQGIVSYKGYP